MRNVIEIKKVSKKYGKVTALSDVSIELGHGIYALLGPNGSGKSTTVKMILGLLAPASGEVSLFGRSPRSVAARSKIGYLPELSYLHPFLTASETLKYYAGLCGLDGRTAAERTRQLLEMVKLSDVAGRRVGDFSKGMARRVALASALIASGWSPEGLYGEDSLNGI